MRESIKSVILNATRYLTLNTSLSSQEIQQNITFLLAYILKKPRSYVLCNQDITLSESCIKKFREKLKKLKEGEPLQYIIGEWDFMGRKFFCNRNVLIPRPSTEQLVELVIKHITSNCGKEKLVIADVGTGSGVIAITLAIALKNALIIATDISKKALMLARKNAHLHQVSKRIIFKHTDLLVGERSLYFDYIVANLPYIPSNQIRKLPCSVRLFEPIIALDGGKNGTTLIERLIEQAAIVLKKGGTIFLECSSTQRDFIKQSLCLQSFRQITFHNDYTNTITFIKAEKSFD